MERCGLIPTSEEMREIYKEGRPTPLTMEEILLTIKKAMEEEGKEKKQMKEDNV